MRAFAFLVAVTLLAFATIAVRARREWARSDELSWPTGMGISALYVLAATLIVQALTLRPWPVSLPLAGALAVGGALIVGGLALAAAGTRPFGSSAGLYGVETEGLVEGGVYRFSRNPQYAGLIVAAAGAAVAGRSLLTLGVAAAVAATLWLWVVALEEPHLGRVFGDRYRRYASRVPRFIGRPRPGPAAG